ncbi:MAG: hypothetical protein M1815_004735 [Lichina confinis]|nr:MAG: hypothetical protein M1815_004735 [Lichina confinis]
MTAELKLALDVLFAEHPNPSPRYLPHQEEVLKMQYIASAFYLSAIGIVKLSILAFYHRFLPRQPYHRIIQFEVFQCLPIPKVWDIQAKCKIKAPVLHLVISVFHLVTDLVILLLPMRVVLKLHTSRKRKVALSVVFALGAVGTVSTALRMWKTLAVVFAFLSAAKSSPVGWLPLVTTVVMWSQVELNLIIVCANLPALSSLWTYARDPSRRSGGKSSCARTAASDTRSYQLESSKASRSAVSAKVMVPATSPSEEQIMPDYHHHIMQAKSMDMRIEDTECAQPASRL